MGGLTLRGCLLTISLMIGQALGAAEEAETDAALNEESIARKLKLLDNFTRAEKTQARLQQSNDPVAYAHFSAAEAAREAAARAMVSGDLQSASSAVATGYREMMLTLQAARDLPAETRQAAERYEALSERVFSFSEAFQRIAVEKNDPDILSLLDQARLGKLTGDAAVLAKQGKYDEANQLMQESATRVEEALSAARNRETLVQELNFQSPTDEFDYELRRNESYEMLVKLLEGRGGAESAIRMMHRLLEQNEQTRAQARNLFEQGRTRDAIEALERRSEEMSRVLQMSGLAF